MGIKAGSGRGSADVGGSKGNVPGGVGSSRKREKREYPPPPPKKPLQPISDSPFPEKKEFRLGHYKVVEEKDDYLLCTGFDPNAKNPFAEVTPSAFRSGVLMKVAKPPALQRTPWDGQTVTVGGTDYTYEYSDDDFGVRWATWTDDNGNSQSEEQHIDIPYVVDDLLIAVQIRKSAAVDGMEVADEDGARLRWIDLNSSGRKWKAVYPRYAKLTSSLSAASAFLTGHTTASAVFVKDNSSSPGDLVADTRTCTPVNRWVDLSLSSGKYVVLERIGKELVIVASECP